jgi:signal transduction histidine kinase
MKQLKTKNGRLIGGIAVFCFVTVILIWTNYYQQKKADKDETIASAVQRNSNLAVALEQYTIRTIHNADAALQLVKMEYARKGNNFSINELLYSNAINSDIFRGVGLINSKGKIETLDLQIKSDTSLSFSGRDYFIYHSKENLDTLLISKPIVSKTIGKPVIVLSRRINKKDGSFGGVAAIQIEPAAFTSFYAQANLRQLDIISLIAPDGITYARRTGSIESSGENISKSPLFTHVSNNPDSFYFAKDALRGIPTFFSYRKFKDYPIIATVGTSEKDVLGGYYKRIRRDLLSTTTISILIILFSFAIYMVLWHRKKMAEKLMEEPQRHERRVTEEVILAQEKEREEIGHELHDNISQVLTTVKLYLELALHSPKTSEDFILKSMHLVMKSINEIRSLSHDLSAPTLGTRSLIDSIYALIETVSNSTGIKILFDHSSCYTSLVMNQKLAIYRITQEQLNNIVKHARATTVSINLSQTDKHTTLVIKDNGKGFNTFEKRNGIGLNNIISRTKVFDGNVNIQSAPGKGCKLMVTLPIIGLEEKVEDTVLL